MFSLVKTFRLTEIVSNDQSDDDDRESYTRSSEKHLKAETFKGSWFILFYGTLISLSYRN